MKQIAPILCALFLICGTSLIAFSQASSIPKYAKEEGKSKKKALKRGRRFEKKQNNNLKLHGVKRSRTGKEREKRSKFSGAGSSANPFVEKAFRDQNATEKEQQNAREIHKNSQRKASREKYRMKKSKIKKKRKPS